MKWLGTFLVDVANIPWWKMLVGGIVAFFTLIGVLWVATLFMHDEPDPSDPSSPNYDPAQDDHNAAGF